MSCLHIELDQNNSSLLHIAWGDEWERVVHKSLFIRSLGKLRACREKEEFLTLFRELEGKIARAEGVRLLSRRGYFGHELKQKLLFKGLSEGAAAEAVSYFEQKGYINDGSRAESLIRHELNKGHGPQHIYQVLKHKKIAAREIDQHRALIENEEKRSLQAYLKKVSSRLKKKDFKEKRKLIAQLLRRGYSYEAIRSCINENVCDWQ